MYKQFAILMLALSLPAQAAQGDLKEMLLGKPAN